MSDNTFTQDFNELKSKDDDAISADQLRDLIETRTERSLDSKTVRAYLRKAFTRDESQKNARWRIDKSVAEQVCEHFDRKSA